MQARLRTTLPSAECGRRRTAGATLIACLAAVAASPASAQRLGTASSRQASAVEPLPLANAALLPDTVVTPRGGPRLIRLIAPGSALTTLRISIPIDEAPAEAGAAQILAQLGLERARAAAASIGARVEGSRTPWGIAYTVVGPTEDFDYLTYVLREAVAEPRLDATVVERMRVRVREEAQRDRETASGRLAALLRGAAAPGTLPLLGTLGSLDRLTPASLRDLWTRTHRRSRMTLVLVGPQTIELVLAALGQLGTTERDAGLAPIARPAGDPAPKAEVLRNWYGVAWVVGDATDPKGAVVASLIARRLRERTSAFESDVELWDVGERRVLAVTGATYAAGAQAMRRRVEGILVEAAGKVTREDLAPAVAALRVDLLSAARTPWGLATLVGRDYDATGQPDAAYRHLTALDDVTAESIHAYVAELEGHGHSRAELRP